MNRTKNIVIFFFFFAAFRLSASAQHRSDYPPLGTKTPYEPAGTDDLSAPAGYTPFFINYTGRHGARHTTSLKELAALSAFLDEAAGSGNLTPEGDSLRVRVDRLLSVEKKYATGSLTQRGRDEQYGIGLRMREHYPLLISGPGDYLDVSYTAEPRTGQSEESFLSAYLTPETKSKLRHVDGSDSIRLRFYDLSPRYRSFARKGPWIERLERLRQSPDYMEQINRMTHRFFKPSQADKMILAGKKGDDRRKGEDESKADERKTGEGGKIVDGASSFFEGIYGVASITEGLKAEVEANGFTSEEVNIFALLLPEEIRWLALQGHARDFLVKGPGMDADGIQVRIALPLLKDLLQTADLSLQQSGHGAHLRFAHAETIAPIASLLELEGAAVADTSLTDYPRVWKVEKIIPFSANIQWILYRNSIDSKRPVLIKVLYNEKAVHLPVATDQYPYYEYQKVRNYYLQKIKKIDAGTGGDMYGYLQQIH